MATRNALPEPVRRRDARGRRGLGGDSTRTTCASPRTRRESRRAASGSSTGCTTREPIYPFDTIMTENWWVACNQHDDAASGRCRRPAGSTTGSSTATSTSARATITDPDGDRASAPRSSTRRAGHYFENWDEIYDAWIEKARGLHRAAEGDRVHAAARDRGRGHRSPSHRGVYSGYDLLTRLRPADREPVRDGLVPLRDAQPRVRRLPHVPRVLPERVPGHHRPDRRAHGRGHRHPAVPARRRGAQAGARWRVELGLAGPESATSDPDDAARRDRAPRAARRRVAGGASRRPRSRGSGTRPAPATPTPTARGCRRPAPAVHRAARVHRRSSRPARRSSARWSASSRSASRITDEYAELLAHRRGPRGVPRARGARAHGLPLRREPQLLRRALAPLDVLEQGARARRRVRRGRLLRGPRGHLLPAPQRDPLRALRPGIRLGDGCRRRAARPTGRRSSSGGSGILRGAAHGRDPPPALGMPPEHITEPIDGDALGHHAARWSTTGSATTARTATGATELRGVAASPGVVRGPARVVNSPEQLHEVEAGRDPRLPRSRRRAGRRCSRAIAAAVSDIGGIMAHTAIVSREYGLPAVVGTGLRDAADRRTGSSIEVDGDDGRGAHRGAGGRMSGAEPLIVWLEDERARAPPCSAASSPAWPRSWRRASTVPAGLRRSPPRLPRFVEHEGRSSGSARPARARRRRRPRGDRGGQRGDRRADRGGADAGALEARDPRRLRRARGARRRAAAAGRGSLERGPRGHRRRELRRAVRHVPVDDGRRRGARPRAPLLGRPVRPAGAHLRPAGRRAWRRGATAMCVGVQQMVPAARRRRGIHARSRDRRPLEGRASRRSGGSARASSAATSRPTASASTRSRSRCSRARSPSKEVEHRFETDSGTVQLLAVEEERRGVPCLQDEQIAELATPRPRRSSATAARPRTSSGRSTRRAACTSCRCVPRRSGASGSRSGSSSPGRRASSASSARSCRSQGGPHEQCRDHGRRRRVA